MGRKGIGGCYVDGRRGGGGVGGEDGVTMREEVSVEVVVAMRRPLEMERNLEPTLPSPLTCILQMRKLRPSGVVGFCCNPGSDRGQIRVPGTSPKAQPPGLIKGTSMPLKSQENVRQISMQKGPLQGLHHLSDHAEDSVSGSAIDRPGESLRF